MRPDFIKNVSALKPEEYERKQDGIAGISRDIGAALGTDKLGVDVTTIRPGKKSSLLHHHKFKEEFFFVLDGRCRIRVGPAVHDLNPGDAVSRPAGTGVPHQFFNPYPKPCDVLMIGVMAGKGVTDEIVWPEIRAKAKVSAAGKRKLIRLKK